VLLAATAALVVLGYWRGSQRNANVSGTASLTGLITMACGFLAGSGESALASAATGVTILVLALRSRLHHLLSHIDEHEMFAIARFALIALVILPLLPDTPFGPYGAWRPRQLWLVVVLVSGLSFAGYAGVKLLGPSRGVLATAAAGAMVSSTAVTASLAGKLRDGTGDPALLNAGIALASAVMFARVMVLTAALAGFALPTFAMLAVPGMLVSFAAAAALLRCGITADPLDQEVKLRNPFDLCWSATAMLASPRCWRFRARSMSIRRSSPWAICPLAHSARASPDWYCCPRWCSIRCSRPRHCSAWRGGDAAGPALRR
jgi:uncharacterized membrane protein (DUF4010 family)